jgi:Holliday junction resolvase RusA-like endonuclease
MSQRDKWAKRAPVLRYRAFCDRVRLMRIEVPPACRVVFHIPMPASWSEKKRRDCVGQPHLSKPDLDNLQKALLDAVYEDDSCVWRIHAMKVWAREGAIEVEPITEGP